MTHEEIIAMAREAGMQANCGHTDRDGVHHPAVAALKTSVPVDWLASFAALVAAKEREACALVCDASVEEWLRLDGSHHELTEAQMLADEIRARGQKDAA